MDVLCVTDFCGNAGVLHAWRTRAKCICLGGFAFSQKTNSFRIDADDSERVGVFALLPFPILGGAGETRSVSVRFHDATWSPQSPARVRSHMPNCSHMYLVYPCLLVKCYCCSSKHNYEAFCRFSHRATFVRRPGSQRSYFTKGSSPMKYTVMGILIPSPYCLLCAAQVGRSSAQVQSSGASP